MQNTPSTKQPWCRSSKDSLTVVMVAQAAMSTVTHLMSTQKQQQSQEQQYNQNDNTIIKNKDNVNEKNKKK